MPRNHTPFAAALTSAFAFTLLPLTAQERAAEAKPAKPDQVNVYALKEPVSEDLVKTLNQFLRDDASTVQAHPQTNSLLVRANGERMPQIVKLIEQLDRRAGGTGEQDPDGIEIPAQDATTIADLVKLVQAETGKVYVFEDASIARTPVKLVGRISMESDDVEPFFRTILQVHGLTAVAGKDGTSRIVRLDASAAASTATSAAHELTDTHVDLDNLDPRILAKDLRGFFGDSVHIIPVGDSRTLAIRGPSEALDRAVALIRHADGAARTTRAVVRTIRLEHLDSNSTLMVLRQFFPARGGGSRSPVPAASQFQAAALDDSTVILRAPAQTMEEMLDVLAQADIPPKSQGGK